MPSATAADTHDWVNQHDDLLHRLLLRVYGRQRHAAKALARDSGASPRTTQKWLAGETAPSGPYFLALLRECQGMQQELQKILDGENADARG